MRTSKFLPHTNAELHAIVQNTEFRQMKLHAIVRNTEFKEVKLSTIVRNTDFIEVTIRVPANDPRFTSLLQELHAAKEQYGKGKRGRGSPLPRMVAEWALLGHLVSRGGQQ